jgi:hypothetical protein
MAARNLSSEVALDYCDDHARREAVMLQGLGWLAPSGIFTRTAPTQDHILQTCADCNGTGGEQEDIGLGQTVLHRCEFCQGPGKLWVRGAMTMSLGANDPGFEPAYPRNMQITCQTVAGFASTHASGLVEELAKAMAERVGPEQARRILALAAERAAK